MSEDVQLTDVAAREAADRAADYEHGWSAEIETEFAPKGLSAKTPSASSAPRRTSRNGCSNGG